MTEVASSGVLRVAKPKCRDMPYMKEQDAELAHLLSIIDSLYLKASDRLAVRTRPIRLGRFLNAGVCIGLLDPVSNILANTICTSNIRPDLREKVLVGAAVERKLHDMCRRSLEGLVAFLIHFFPYLPRWEAVRYLLLAEADLLAAAHLIVADRGMAARFSLTSSASAPAFEAGLMLAAQIAEHPHPKRFVHAWMSLSSRLHHVLALVRDRGMPYYSAESSAHDNLDLLRRLLDDPVVPYLAIPWDLAASRPMCISGMANIPYQHTRSLRMVLLDTIHGFYLQAMAMLPSSELRSRLHRSLLKAGYCYGPLDPVSNIIFNTIWYEANFPAQVTPKLNLIGPKSLTRLVTRSFYGLVSFLQTCYHNLSEHQAVRCLVRTCCQLSVADPNFCAPGDDKAHCSDDHLDQFTSSPLVLTKEVQQIPSASIREGYEAAATAARHPNPKRQAMFLASRPWGMNQIKDNLCLEELQYLFNLLSPDQPPIPERICSSSWPVRIGKRRSQAQQSRISRKVEAALKRHMLRDGEPEFDLHIICCVNEDVCGPEYCDDIEDDLSFAPCKYRYTHVNFLATQKGSLFSCPILFFAEFDNEEEDGAPLSFCQVAEPTPFTEHVRCLYCEARGARVVHPTSEKFHGGGSEFEKMIRGELSLSNDFLICKNEYAVQHIYSVEEDFMYVDVA